MTSLEIRKLVTVMVAAYPATKAQDDTVSVYERMLSDLDYPAANAAVEQLLATSKWMPTVAEIRDRVVSLTTGEVRAGGEAWGSVLKAVSRCGRYRTPGVDFEFSDPVTREAVAAFGWQNLCDSENAIADRARFVELYDQLAVKYRRLQLSEDLPAMQRFRALQAGREVDRDQRNLEGSPARSIGELIRGALPSGDLPS